MIFSIFLATLWLCGVGNLVSANHTSMEDANINEIKANFTIQYPVVLEQESYLAQGKYDGVVVISTNVKESFDMARFGQSFQNLARIDRSFPDRVSVLSWNNAALVHSPTGPINRDQDDVRAFAEAAENGVTRAISAGARKIAIILPKTIAPFSQFSVDASCLLGSLQALYVPLEVREDKKQVIPVITKIALINFNGGQERLNYLLNIEYGRIIARDLCGSNPERMAPPEFAKYVDEIFEGSPVKASIISDLAEIERRYPLCAAVARATRVVERHHVRVVHLTYVPQDGSYSRTLGIVGKGVTFDSGGVDVKPTGTMLGQHRDKAGASGVVGLFATIKEMKPRDVKVLGSICVVRNSIGSDALVPDEILMSRSGYRVRVTNTDLEGRFAMADGLDEMRETIENEPNPQIFTVATLTGHAIRTVGLGYAIAMDNGVARQRGICLKLQQQGMDVGEMFDISTVRREDYAAVAKQSPYEDLIQGPSQPTTQVNRGHQTPTAFLIRVSRLDEHGINSSKPIPYTHLDIAAAHGPFPGIPSGLPVATLTTAFIQSIP